MFHSCQSANRFRRYFLMSDGSECRLLQQFTLLCWAQTGERGKWEKHDENLKQITFKNSKSRFHKERITPVTLYLKTTFFPVTLFLKCDGSERAKSESVKERFPNPDFWGQTVPQACYFSSAFLKVKKSIHS